MKLHHKIQNDHIRFFSNPETILPKLGVLSSFSDHCCEPWLCLKKIMFKFKFKGLSLTFRINNSCECFSKVNFFFRFSELSKSGTIVEWGECMADCPKEDVTAVCVMEPG
jgi:hypothetical protein